MKNEARLTPLILLSSFIASTSAFGLEARIEEADLSITLPGAWTAKYEEVRLPTGQLIQRWLRDSIAVGNANASPGLIAIATPVSEEANLALLTQSLLARPPHQVRIAADTQCIKCVTYTVKAQGGTFSAVSPTIPPNCSERIPDAVATCQYQWKNLLGITIEPSWAHRFEKNAPYGKSYALVVHTIVGQKLVDLTFVYPKQAAYEVEPEIIQITSSIRRTSNLLPDSAETNSPSCALGAPPSEAGEMTIDQHLVKVYPRLNDLRSQSRVCQNVWMETANGWQLWYRLHIHKGETTRISGPSGECIYDKGALSAGSPAVCPAKAPTPVASLPSKCLTSFGTRGGCALDEKGRDGEPKE